MVADIWHIQLVAALGTRNMLSSDDWVADSGASRNIANHTKWFTTLGPSPMSMTLTTPTGHALPQEGEGTVEIPLRSPNAVVRKLKIHHVIYSPNSPTNLFSVGIARTAPADKALHADTGAYPSVTTPSRKTMPYAN